MKQSIKQKLQLKANKMLFDSDEHKYCLEENYKQNFVSVSALVEKYKPPFDPDGSITTRCALKKGITPREMSDEWKAQSKESTDKGTLIHQICENFLNGCYDMPEGLTQEIALKVPLIHACCEELKPYLISTEQIIYNESSGVAGTTDVLTYYNGKIDIWDWKTDKKPIEIDNNPSNNYFLPPLQSLPCNSYYYYALKMSVYRYLLELDGYEVNTLGLLHIKKDKIDEIELPYLLDEVKLIMNNHLPIKVLGKE